MGAAVRPRRARMTWTRSRSSIAIMPVGALTDGGKAFSKANVLMTERAILLVERVCTIR